MERRGLSRFIWALSMGGLIISGLSACASPSQAELSTAQALAGTLLAETERAALPTHTSTPAPTDTPIPTPTETISPTVQPTPFAGGGSIAFASRRDGDYEIYASDPQGSTLTQITQNFANDREPAWSSSGDQIAFISTVEGENLGLFRIELGGGGQTMIVKFPERRGGSPSWSEADKLVYWAVTCIYACDKGGIQRTQIYFIRPGGTDMTTLEALSPSSIPLDTAWSPDGQRLAALTGVLPWTNIAVVSTNGTILAELYQFWQDRNYKNSREPAWSPDGSTIAFVSDQEGNFEIYTWHIERDQVQRLTREPGSDRHPSWSPDGQHLVFASDRSGNWDIYLMRSDGTGISRLTNDPAADVEPAWSR
jgi:TolB protein